MISQLASTEIATRTTAVINELKGLEGPLLPILHGLQDEFGYVPGESLPVIADAL
ncbi:MAG TPA: formate dehydrogenase subunit gamma, partial [Rhizobiaceae bacterium]